MRIAASHRVVEVNTRSARRDGSSSDLYDQLPVTTYIIEGPASDQTTRADQLERMSNISLQESCESFVDTSLDRAPFEQPVPDSLLQDVFNPLAIRLVAPASRSGRNLE